MVFSTKWNTLWNKCLLLRGPVTDGCLASLVNTPIGLSTVYLSVWCALNAVGGTDSPTRNQELPWETMGIQSLTPEHSSRACHVSGAQPLHWLLFRWASEKKKKSQKRTYVSIHSVWISETPVWWDMRNLFLQTEHIHIWSEKPSGETWTSLYSVHLQALSQAAHKFHLKSCPEFLRRRCWNHPSLESFCASWSVPHALI